MGVPFWGERAVHRRAVDQALGDARQHALLVGPQLRDGVVELHANVQHGRRLRIGDEVIE
jgi:hypothetical protein